MVAFHALIHIVLHGWIGSLLLINQVLGTSATDNEIQLPVNSAEDVQICPPFCNCKKRELTNSILIVDCSFGTLDTFPTDLPPNICFLNLSQNQMRDFSFDAHSNDLFRTVESLDLSFNRFPVLETFLSGWQWDKLKHLNASNNKIRSVPHTLQHLSDLKLSNNSIEIVDLIPISSSTLQRLYLDGNRISELHGVCKDLNGREDKDQTSNSQLEVLNLSSNKISNIHRCAFSPLKRLKYISLARNQISKLSDILFKDNLALKVIDLSQNSLQHLPENIFQPVQFLEYLYLSGNKFTQLPGALPVLNWLDMSYNNIQTIREDEKNVLYPQEVFLLGGNPFICDCSLLWLKELFDVREYLLKFIRVEKEKFVPVCAAPDNLAGETWDNVGDEMFKCSLDQEKDLAANDAKWQEVLSPEQQMTTTAVGPDFVKLSFENCPKPREDVSVYITYHPFGKKSQRKQSLLPESSASTRFSISGLQPRTPYVICRSERSIDVEDVVTVHSEHCIEVITEKPAVGTCTQDNTEDQSTSYFQGFLNYVLACLVTIICLFWALKYLGILVIE